MLWVWYSFDRYSYAGYFSVCRYPENKEEADCLYCAMLDARRMEVYSSIYDSHLNTIRATTADIVDADSYASF